MGRLRKVLVGAVAALATLGAGLVGAGTASAAGSETITLNGAGGSTLSGTFRAYKLVGYGTVHYGASGETTRQTGDSYVESVTAADVDTSPTSPAVGVRSTVNDALNSVGVSSSPSTASHELLNMASSSPKVPQIASYLEGQIAHLSSGSAGDAYPVTDTIPAGSSPTSVTLNVDPGLYLIVHGTMSGTTFTPDTASASDAVSPMILSSTIGGLSWMGAASPNGEKIGSADVKNGAEYKPTKTYTADGATGTNPHVGVGDTAHFTIAMNIPDSASHQAFTLTDTPSGYTIDQNSIRFYHVPADTTADHYANYENQHVGEPGETNNNSHEIASVIHNPSGVTLPTGVNPIARYHTPLPSAITYPNLTWSGAAPSGSDKGVADEGFTLTDHAFDILRDSSSDPATDSWINSHKNDSSIIRRFSGQKLIVTYDARVDKDNASNAVSSRVWDYSGNSTPSPGNTTHNDAYDPLATFQKVMASDRNRGVNNVEFSLQNVGRPASPGVAAIAGTNKYWTRSYDSSTGKWGDWSQHDTLTGTGNADYHIVTTRARVSGSGTSADPYHYKDGIIDLDGLSDGVYRLTETGFVSPHKGTVSPAGTSDRDASATQSDAGLMDPRTSGAPITTVSITITVSDTSVSSSATGLTSGLWNQSQPGTPTKYVYTGDSTTPNDFGSGANDSKRGTPALFSLGNMRNISELPATGGEGILAALLLLALLLVVGGTLIAISRKMRRDRLQAQGVRE